MCQFTLRRLPVMLASLVLALLLGCNSSSDNQPMSDAGAPRESTPRESTTPASSTDTSTETPRPAPAEPDKPRVVVDVMPEEEAAPAAMPPVVMSEEYLASSLVKVGDALPSGTLKKLDGSSQTLADLLGERLTVVVFWKADGLYDTAEIQDLTEVVVQPFKSRGVEVVAVNVEDPAEVVEQTVKKAGAEYPLLLDADGTYFAQVATGRLPRTYLLDASGKILWFDIGYQRTTRRQLADAIRYSLAN